MKSHKILTTAIVIALLLQIVYCQTNPDEAITENRVQASSLDKRLIPVNRAIENWDFAAIYKISSNGVNQLVVTLKENENDEVSKPRDLLEKTDYNLISQAENKNDTLYYIYIKFSSSKQIVNGATSELSGHAKIIKIGWGEYKNASVAISSLTNEKELNGVQRCKIVELIDIASGKH